MHVDVASCRWMSGMSYKTTSKSTCLNYLIQINQSICKMRYREDGRDFNMKLY